jgi:hypothetical protein
MGARMQADNISLFPTVSRAGRYGSRRVCTVRGAGGELAVVLCSVSATGAFVETEGSMLIGSSVTLLHPEAGGIAARVARVARDGAALAFTPGEQATTFALAAMCADMTIRARRDDV